MTTRNITWREFKEYVENSDIRDEDIIAYIVWNGPVQEPCDNPVGIERYPHNNTVKIFNQSYQDEMKRHSSGDGPMVFSESE